MTRNSVYNEHAECVNADGVERPTRGWNTDDGGVAVAAAEVKNDGGVHRD